MSAAATAPPANILTTGTPLIAGEEEATREQFVNENFSDELDAPLEAAELDEDAEGQLAREFGTRYTWLSRPERLKTLAKDLARHFVGRGTTRFLCWNARGSPTASSRRSRLASRVRVAPGAPRGDDGDGRATPAVPSCVAVVRVFTLWG